MRKQVLCVSVAIVLMIRCSFRLEKCLRRSVCGVKKIRALKKKIYVAKKKNFACFSLEKEGVNGFILI